MLDVCKANFRMARRSWLGAKLSFVFLDLEFGIGA